MRCLLSAFVCFASLGFPAETPVLIQTELGDIEMMLDADRAPVTTRNFLRYLDAGSYDGGIFHRTVRMDNQPTSPVKIEVVQAGRRAGTSEYAPIPLERTSQTNLKHTDGAISMARSGPDTATSDFFICIGNQPSLDFGGARNPDGQGFAAFGHVTKGMSVVRAIQTSKAQEQKLVPPVKILHVRRR